MTFHFYKPNKNLFFALLAAMTVLMLMTAIPAMSQTPDETTPAEEGVCDVLQADGTTKGLYGLCVAFCEAHDTTTLSTPITPEALEALEARAPSGKILANYKKRKQDSDPDMPCLLVEETCPCFSDAELSSLDGFPRQGQVLDRFICWVDFDSSSDISSLISEGTAADLDTTAFMRSENFTAQKFCAYEDSTINPIVSRALGINQGTLTSEQYEACRAKLNDHIATTQCTQVF